MIQDDLVCDQLSKQLPVMVGRENWWANEGPEVLKSKIPAPGLNTMLYDPWSPKLRTIRSFAAKIRMYWTKSHVLSISVITNPFCSLSDNCCIFQELGFQTDSWHIILLLQLMFHLQKALALSRSISGSNASFEMEYERSSKR